MSFDPGGWVPYRFDVAADEATIAWCHLAGRRLNAPFFDTDVAVALAHPFNRAFDVRTTIGQSVAMLAEHPPLPIAALVFHTGRCGSTLVAQLAGVDPATRVVSEPAPLDRVLRAPLARPVDAGEHAAWIRTVVGALAQGAPGEQRCIVKLDSWSVVAADLLDAVFPEVPWLFVVRDPLEVLVSQLSSPPMTLLAGAVPPELFGVPKATAAGWSLARYGAHVQAALLTAMGRHAGRATVVDHGDLPGAVVPWLAHIGLDPAPDVRAAMEPRTAVHAKYGRLYEDDRSTKQALADDELRALVDAAARPAWHALLAARTASPAPHLGTGSTDTQPQPPNTRGGGTP